jgi:peptidoglycan/LPS O-acetylase OafA/YrhL
MADRVRPEDMPALIGIRFPLAIWVVVHHLSGPGNLLHGIVTAQPLLHALIAPAWVALGVFFAISGFVLTLRYGGEPWSRDRLRRYGIARLARVYPVYLFSLLVIAPIAVGMIRSGETGDVGQTAGILLNYALLLQGWSRPEVDWNTPAWSLSCEMFFYALFPAVVLAVRNVSWARAWGMLLLAFAIGFTIRASGVPTEVKPLIYLSDFLSGIADLFHRL